MVLIELLQASQDVFVLKDADCNTM